MTETDVVPLTIEDNIAIISLGGPEERVVTLTEGRCASLEHRIDQVASNDQLQGLVIRGSTPKMFGVGADISAIKEVQSAERGAELARLGQRLFQKIENLKIPTVAAVGGPCVGGACELTLACDYRIIADSSGTLIGLPEVKIGILPGFGGTQRLPRLIGLPRALDIILAGKTLRPKQAKKAGLVQKIVPVEKLLEEAKRFAHQKPPKPPLSFLTYLLTFTSLGRSRVASKARKTLEAQTKGNYPAPLKALEVTLAGLAAKKLRAYEEEAIALGELVVTPESKSLIHVFFQTEAAKRLGKIALPYCTPKQVLMLGAGAMGSGITELFARKGIPVTLRDMSNDALIKARSHIKKLLEKRRYLSQAEREAIEARIVTTTGSHENDKDIDVVIEAIVEDLDIKKKVFAELSKNLPNTSLFLSNTSSLSVTEMSGAVSAPDNFAGMHFFNPVHKMPLVEVVRGEKTEDRTVVLVAALASKLGKFPIVVSDVPGFLVNRILGPYMNEALFLLEEGYAPADIEKAALDFGMPMGPLRVFDEVGIDITKHVSEVLVAGYGERMKPPTLAEKFIEAKRLGRKTGKGFYDFSKSQPELASDLKAFLGVSEAEKSSPEVKTLQDRLFLPMVNEAVLCLDEGVAGAPGPEAAGQIDLGSVMGSGFPPFRGGVLYWANSLGAKELQERMTELSSSTPRLQPALGVVERARLAKSFYEEVGSKDVSNAGAGAS